MNKPGFESQSERMRRTAYSRFAFKTDHRIARRSCVFLSCLLICCGLMFETATAQRRRLYPVDESARNPSFRVFRNRLLRAARARDTRFILSILAPDIQNSFGGSGGVREFRETWRIERRESRFWNELITVLELGGTFEGSGTDRYFGAPYTFTRFPENLDAFTHAVIVGRSVRAHSRPAASAPVVATLTYDIVRADYENSVRDGDDDYAWLRITTPAGRPAFVQARNIRSPIDYRAIFTRSNGRWMMTSFIAGD